MNSRKPKNIAVISMMRNDNFFVNKWIDYYGKQFGKLNLFLVLDGQDQVLPENHGLINVIRVPHTPLGRAGGDRNRARLLSHLAKALFRRYQVVIATDIDEFLVVDPNLQQSLAEYLQKPIKHSSLSALGLDVGQHLKEESAIDPSLPFLEQRKYAHVSARYTKAVIATRPVTWGSGFHRVKGRNFHIDPNLYLFHFGMVDYNRVAEKSGDPTLTKHGWEGHLARRYQLFDLITNKTARDGDEFFNKARLRQNIFRPLFAINKPGTLREKPVIKIPERFSGIL